MNVAFNFILGMMTTLLFMVSHDSAAKPVVPVSEPPYGHWWLLNPETLQPNLIAGELIICRQNDKAACDDEEVMLVLLEKNTGHGCTDYVGTGTVKQNPVTHHWQIYLDEEGKHNLWATATRAGNNLRLQLVDSDRVLKLEQSDPENIDKKAKNACDNSLKDFMKSNKSTRSGS